ncbi:DUF3775 domain-containing protein [Coxiella burnetii]|uniref:DUF3775 domain-containing protein n=1 Tax=Coxiella burnetii (strain Dugway 5J108-111) TaxID=434922 RepID=A9KDQ5_COXBN|nr:DUF3775 domain-containing protein [Coxiella burnetii]ABS77190.2 hypothetical protein CBUD_0728 [Coxiella burnetii Dugway 5J108-111]OYK80600.1 DUF3775 domain-containing protein [Coxiella burnetii]OYK82689.1 DUF3775 domain-containing protein [Coxiella burnetii]
MRMRNKEEAMSFDLSLLIVDEIIARARAFHAKEGVVFPENVNESSEEDFQQILADHQNDLTYRELKEAINNLEPDQQMQLVALMYLGRGDFSDWEESFAEAEAGWTNRTAEYLLSKPQLADYLEAGLDAMGYRREG